MSTPNHGHKEDSLSANESPVTTRFRGFSVGKIQLSGIPWVSPTQRFWGASDRLTCGSEEAQETAQNVHVVVPRDAVGADDAAAPAAVEERQFAVVADPEADGVHDASAQAAPVAHRDIHMEASEAARAVIALLGSQRLSRHGVAAMGAEEGLARAVEGASQGRTLIARHALTFS